MINFDESRKIAYEEFSKFNSSRLLSSGERKMIYSECVETWEVISEIENPQGVSVDCTFYICFNDDFPLSLPRIYLSQADYDCLKYIPHVDTAKLICTYDEEGIITDINNSAGIVLECFQRAKRIIEEGIQKKNTDDFEEEFDAYWKNTYNDGDKVKLNYLSLLPTPVTGPIKVLVLSKPLGTYTKILHQDDEVFKKFISWLKSEAISYHEDDVLYLGNIEGLNIPPFNFTNKDIAAIHDILPTDQQKVLHSYLKAHLKTPTIIFSKVYGGAIRYYGWELNQLILNRNGFRPGSITPIDALTGFQKNENVARLIPEDYTPQRLSLRTAGSVQPAKRTFFVAGLGSIGSNLLHFLDSFHSPNFILCDPDCFLISNLERHLLTIKDVNLPKVMGLKKLLLQKNNQRVIETHEKSLVTLINNEQSVINDSDAMFVCIGKDSIDNYIAAAIEAGIITVPTFFLWVEPYLCAGHCLYVHPSAINNYQSYYDLGFFKYNAIDVSEYFSNNPLLGMREAGCQSGYVPFSNADIVLFISALYPHIFKLLLTPQSKCISFSWFGDLSNIQNKKIKLSKFAQSGLSHTLQSFVH